MPALMLLVLQNLMVAPIQTATVSRIKMINVPLYPDLHVMADALYLTAIKMVLTMKKISAPMLLVSHVMADVLYQTAIKMVLTMKKINVPIYPATLLIMAALLLKLKLLKEWNMRQKIFSLLPQNILCLQNLISH